MIAAETGIWIVLIMLSGWDLYKQELPILLLIILTGISVWSFAESALWNQLLAAMSGIMISMIGVLLAGKGKMGGGDIWVFVCLALAWPAEVFWNSMLKGSIILCMAAVGIWWCTKDEKQRIPVLPFLLLGYCMKG